MRVLKRAALLFLMLFLLVTLVGWLLPSRFSVERSIVVRAPPEAIFPLVASYRDGWAQWSPFGLAADPTLHLVFEGPASGVGAAQRWTGGRGPPGAMRITRADPQRGVDYKLLLDDDAFALDGALAFAPAEGGGTRVTWSDAGDVGRNPYRHLGGPLLVSMLGDSFDQGLQSLKAKAEGAKAEAAKPAR